MEQFAVCFQEADTVFLLPVYAASEQPIPGADHHALAAALKKARQSDVRAFDSREAAVAAAATWGRWGDTIVTQGAGDVTRASNELVSRL